MDSSSLRTSRKLHKSMRPPGAHSKLETREIYILVMGLTGAGKSTFISVATGDETIEVGKPEDLEGVTQDVQDYILIYNHNNIEYEIHLIDSPGFDDGTMNDAEVLHKIATYVNTIYMLKHRIAGFLYLHDITKARMGGVGLRNLRMLEEMIGVDKWDNCTIVTTKWGCTDSPEGEAIREKKLRNDDKYFRSMCESSHKAYMKRFMRTKGSALDIIKPHLDRKFAPAISMQMVDPKGPRLALGQTDAGRIVIDNLEKANLMIEEAEQARKLLEAKFDEILFEDFRKKRDALRREQSLHRAGRWSIRTTLVAGGIVATVLTAGPGAGAFVLVPAYEKFARLQKKEDREKEQRLEEDYKKESMASQRLTERGSQWLKNKNVKNLKDLDSEEHSLASSSRTSLSLSDAKQKNADDLPFRKSESDSRSSWSS